MDNPEELAKKMAKERVDNLKVTSLKSEEDVQKSKKALIITLSVLGTLLAGATVVFFTTFHGSFDELLGRSQEPEPEPEPEIVVKPTEVIEEDDTPHYYSTLTGEELKNEADNSKPTFCVQIPNGLDGARPQAGLEQAKVVFEAIAETGITRFAAIFQDPPAVIGPIRSLRLYYLNWDVPFDCTVVHAGGSPEALKTVRDYGTKDLTENYTYMWRSSSNYTVQRLWNNLFTSGEYLNNFANINGYLTSDIRAFPRFTPSDNAKNLIDVQAVSKLKIDTPTTDDTDALKPKVSKITMHIGAMPTFNPVYEYNQETNTYKRFYETGQPHTSYDCNDKTGEVTPELVCEEKQIEANVVIGMLVQERKASYDNYHEDISTIGAGEALIFQNGTVISATWEKPSKDAQISFKDSAGNAIKLTPGKTWITAVPASYGGSVEY